MRLHRSYRMGRRRWILPATARMATAFAGRLTERGRRRRRAGQLGLVLAKSRTGIALMQRLELRLLVRADASQRTVLTSGRVRTPSQAATQVGRSRSHPAATTNGVTVPSQAPRAPRAAVPSRDIRSVVPAVVVPSPRRGRDGIALETDRRVPSRAAVLPTPVTTVVRRSAPASARPSRADAPTTSERAAERVPRSSALAEVPLTPAQLNRVADRVFSVLKERAVVQLERTGRLP